MFILDGLIVWIAFHGSYVPGRRKNPQKNIYIYIK